MDILLHNIGKRFTTGWVFRNINQEINVGDHLAITGRNGSGKSTLLQIICGYLTNTEGKVTYTYKGKEVSRDNIFKQLAISTAYMELDEELTATEIFEHNKIFKPYLIQDVQEFLELVKLTNHQKKEVKYYSSGMKQRLSLGLALCMDLPLLFLDEPTSFLDVQKKEWFKTMLERFAKGKTVIIASNDGFDIESCNKEIVMG